ncbi:MAG: hypothetical protein CVU22_00295 [Betaproteobacteria bacterium HGW-Betaproteobacteria-16]|nr:MAG: hypothetical protein CVU22_00295 [Betaproteobacteria bacterium HGW-Betaproteobacteria-16]
MDILQQTTPPQAHWQPLTIRYDSVVLPEDIARWQQACRFAPHRADGVAVYHKLSLNADTLYLERLAWAAMSLYQEALNDELNAVALQTQKWLSESAQDPDIRAYARFMGHMLSEREIGHNQNSAAVDPSLPDWMADDWQILGMVQAREEEERLRRFNALLASKGLTTVEALNADGRDSPLLDRLTSRRDTAQNSPVDPAKLVSVILPVYNAESTIETSVRSLLSQTWPHIEIIAVDDASTDASAAVLQEMARQDSRLRIVQSDRNRGAYPARNLGLAQAQGQFVTVADSDDWHHPEKVEQQVTCLMANPHLIATMSAGLRATEDLTPVARARPYYKHANLSSLMFPRLKIMETLGAWNAVRFGADTEFFNRLAMVFGADSLLTIDLPLFVGRVRADSLTNDPLHGYVGHDLGARKEYVECYRFFQRHASGSALTFPLAPDAALPFPVPRLSVHRSAVPITCDIVYASDLRDEHQATRAIYHHRMAAAKGQRLELLHVPAFNPVVADNVAPLLRDYLFKHGKALISAGENLRAELLVHHASVSPAQIKQLYPEPSFQMTQQDSLVNSNANTGGPTTACQASNAYDVQALLELKRKLPQELQLKSLEMRLKYENIRKSSLGAAIFQYADGDLEAIAKAVKKVSTAEEFKPFQQANSDLVKSRWKQLLHCVNTSATEGHNGIHLTSLLLQELRDTGDHRVNMLLANLTTEDTAWLDHLNKYLHSIDGPMLRLNDGIRDKRILRLSGCKTRSDDSIGGPLVSVIMPCFNAEKYVEWAARSILQQTWKNLELILVDDCSTDGTPSILKNIAASDARVKLLRTPFNAGPYVAKNQGVLAAQGEYITGHDADDWAVPTRISGQLQSQVGLGQPIAVGYMLRISPLGKFTQIASPGMFSPDGVLRKASISAFMKADFFHARLGSWDNVRYGADSEFLARAAIALGHEVALTKTFTMFCLDLESSLTNQSESQILSGTLTGTRLEYKESWLAWHSQLGPDQTFLSLNSGRNYFNAPLKMQNKLD